MSELKDLTPLIITIVFGGLAIVFRAELRKLTDWLVSFRHITKTKEGYSLVGGTDPDQRAAEQPTKSNIAAVSKGLLPQEKTVEQPTKTTIAVLSEDVSPSETQAKSKDEFEWIEALTSREFDDALRLLHEQLDRTSDPDDRLRLRTFIAHTRFERNVVEGITDFENLIKEYPSKAIIYEWYGRSYVWKHLPEKAIAIFVRALETVQEKAQFFDSLSDAYVQAGDEIKAIEAATRGIAADPSYWENHINLAAIYARRKETALAREWYLKALLGSSNSERVLASYAAFLVENKMTDEAMLRYQQLTQLFPDNVTYHTLLGNIYLLADLSDCALTEYLIADKKADSKEGWILGNIGNIYNNRGLHSVAVEYLQKALTIDPTSQYAHERLAGAMKKRDDERKKLELKIGEARKLLAQPAVAEQEGKV